MHLSDGVLNVTTAITTSLAAGGLLAYGIKSIKEEEIPKISLMTAAFFTLSLISIPIGPSSVHPLLAGLLGIFLGRRCPIAIFVGLLLQAMIFQHGGLTTLGVNTLLISIPALISHGIYKKYSVKLKSPSLLAGFLGGFSIFISVSMLVFILYINNSQYSEGFLSVINILIISHIPLVVLESVLTGFTLAYLSRRRPGIITNI